MKKTLLLLTIILTSNLCNRALSAALSEDEKESLTTYIESANDKINNLEKTIKKITAAITALEKDMSDKNSSKLKSLIYDNLM